MNPIWFCATLQYKGKEVKERLSFDVNATEEEGHVLREWWQRCISDGSFEAFDE